MRGSVVLPCAECKTGQQCGIILQYMIVNRFVDFGEIVCVLLNVVKEFVMYNS